jgi:riboflavin transporter FmnP
MVAGTVTMTVVGCFVNAYVLLPAFAKLYGGMPVSALIEMGTAVNGLVTNMFTFVIFAVAPVNILKGILIGIITIPVYKNLIKLTKI